MGLKYFCEYRTLNTNELWKVTIDIPDYSGTPIEKMAAAEQACIIDWNGGDNFLEKFAIPSSASITLLFDDDDQIRELQLLGDKTAQVKVYRNGGTQLYWQGYLISDGIQFPDSGVMTPITLTAVDMVEAANDIPFSNISVEAITVDGQVGADNSPLNWIRKSLINPDNIDNRLPIRWSCSLKNLQYPDDDFFAGRTGFIHNYGIFASSRQDINVGWFLENIAKSADCLFFQYDGYWYLVSLVDLANNNTLDFYQIGGDDLAAKTATVVSLSLEQTLPTKLNEATFSMVQKPISKVKSTYNHSMPSNIIPNGGFDITDTSTGLPLYWTSENSSVVLTSTPPINGRTGGRSLRIKNNASSEQVVTFSASGISSMPLDANLLFRDMQWGFTFMPVNYPTVEGGLIDWDSKPLQVSIIYTGYEGGALLFFYLNEFGYWAKGEIIEGVLTIDNVAEEPQNERVITFSGNAVSGQIFKMSYIEFGDPVNYEVVFTSPLSLEDAMIKIASEIPNATATENTISYTIPVGGTNFSVSIGYPILEQPKIPFKVDQLKNNDIATVQFQSKGNQGRVLFPDPGILDAMRALESGKLSVEIVVKAGHEVYFDDVYMNVSDNKEFWDISDGGTDGKSEYELEISSSFSGFMTSSYMDNFATSDLSMIMHNGTDIGTLTEIFGKTALRFLSKPTSKIDTEVAGEIGLLKLLSYNGGKFIPLKSSVNTETNSSKLTIFELNYDSDLELTSAHRSTGDGDNSSFSTGGYGGGSSGGGSGGAEFLFELGDVSINSPSNGEALIYNSATGKWENESITVDLSNYYTKSESDNRYSFRDASNINVSNYKTVLGLPSSGGYDLQSVTDRGNTTTNEIIIVKSGFVASFGEAGNQIRIYSDAANQAPTITSSAGKSIRIEAGGGGNATTILPNGFVEVSGQVTASQFNGPLNGNASTVTNGVYTTGSYANPSWLTSLAYSKLTGAPTALSQFTNDLNLGSVYQPLENQRLSTGNNVVFASVRATSVMEIPEEVSGTPTGNVFKIYVKG